MTVRHIITLSATVKESLTVLLLLTACTDSPTHAQCCIDKRFANTCDTHLYERVGTAGDIRRDGQCPK